MKESFGNPVLAMCSCEKTISTSLCRDTTLSLHSNLFLKKNLKTYKGFGNTYNMYRYRLIQRNHILDHPANFFSLQSCKKNRVLISQDLLCCHAWDDIMSTSLWWDNFLLLFSPALSIYRMKLVDEAINSSLSRNYNFLCKETNTLNSLNIA